MTVIDCTGRLWRTRWQDHSHAGRMLYNFTREVTPLARPVHVLPVQHHSILCSPLPNLMVFILEHWPQSAPSRFWPPSSCCTTSMTEISPYCGESQFLPPLPPPLGNYYHTVHDHISYTMYTTCTGTTVLSSGGPPFGCHCNSTSSLLHLQA